MFRRVLVGIDGSPGCRDAVVLAKQLAAPGAAITLAHIHAEHRLFGGSSLAIITERAEAEMMLERERDLASLDARLAVHSDARVGRGLHVLAERLGADLLVVGSPSHGLLGRVFMGDDARSALNGAPCAVAIASRGYRHHTHDVETLGVGYDGSPESGLALAAARDLAAQHGATIWALQVLSLADVRDETPIPADWPAGTRRMIHETIERLSELGDDVEGDAVYGGPREELVRFGDNLDLLLVGSRGYGPIGRLFHGSVTDYLARHAPCPLLIMPRGSGMTGPAAGSDRAQVPVVTGSRD